MIASLPHRTCQPSNVPFRGAGDAVPMNAAGPGGAREGLQGLCWEGRWGASKSPGASGAGGGPRQSVWWTDGRFLGLKWCHGHKAWDIEIMSCRQV